MNLIELEQSNPILYVDMDGVLADFYGPFNKMAGVKHWGDADKKTISKVLKRIANSEEFWISLKVLPDVPKLMSAIGNLLKGDYIVLSKAPATSDANAVIQKKQWINKLPLRPRDTIIMPSTGNKGKYAVQSDGTKNILIDDFGLNIKKWIEAGGIGIQHKDGDVNTTIQQLKKAVINNES